MSEVTNEELLNSLQEALNDEILFIPRDKLRRIQPKLISNELFQKICLKTNHVLDLSRCSLSERVYSLENKITKIPICPECGEKVNFLNSGKYAVYCSVRCSANSKSTRDKCKETNKEKYGVENPSQNLLIHQKKETSCLIKFGYRYPNQSPQIMEMSKKKYNEKTGYDYSFLNPEVKKKIKYTMNEKYGVDYPLQSEEIYKKFKATLFKNFGVNTPAESKIIQDKMSISMANNFQLRRNEEGTDYSGVVYILHFPHLKAIKIGLTGDFNLRSKGLISDFGEFSVVDIIETDECFKLESSLHEKFSEYRICLEEGCGRTEFFKEEILKEINE